MSEGSVQATSQGRGFLEYADPYCLRGWAISPSGAAAIVLAATQGGRAFSACTGIPRDDVAREHGGDGRSGFIINCSPPLQPSELANVRLCAMDAGADASFTLEISHECRRTLDELAAQTYIGAMFEGAEEPAAPVRCEKYRLQDRFRDVTPGNVLFILGSPRSGTSALLRAIVDAGVGRGDQEGSFFPILANLSNTVDAHFAAFASGPQSDTSLHKMNREGFKAELTRLAWDYLARCRRVEGVWVDKTPGAQMIRCVPGLLHHLPNARALYIQRRPLENISSRKIKFVDRSFRQHCQEWLDTADAWRSVRDSMAGKAVELDYYELLTDTPALGAGLAHLVGAAPESGGRLASLLASNWPQRSASLHGEFHELASGLWSREECDEYRASVGPAAEEHGYSVDRSYWRTGGEFAWIAPQSGSRAKRGAQPRVVESA